MDDPATSVEPTRSAPAAEMAYSAELVEPVEVGQSASWWRPALLAAAILAGAGALAGVIYFVGQPVAPTAGDETTSAAAAVPPPLASTVTVTAEAPVPPTTSPAAPSAVTVTVEPQASLPATVGNPPMVSGAVIDQRCDPYGLTFGRTLDGQVLMCPRFGRWVEASPWYGVRAAGSPCPSGSGAAVTPSGIGLVCVTGYNDVGTWQPGP